MSAGSIKKQRDSGVAVDGCRSCTDAVRQHYLMPGGRLPEEFEVRGQGQVIDTLSKACAYGDFEKLKEFIDQDPSCVSKPDESGYFPLQWAALNNRVNEANYLISHGANVNTTDHTGQTALHWSAVRGSLPVLEALLKNNADVELKDNRGYTLAHVAAQYGQTAVIYLLALKWCIDIDSPDNDGRTSLHWAAYKGFADTTRLLLVLDARYTLADKEGCTPLHWAAIKGNGEACTVLLQGGSASVLAYKDVTGSSPAQLAVEKGHRYLGMHLADYKHKGEDTGDVCGKNGPLPWLTNTQLCPVIWVLCITLLLVFMYKVMTPPHEHLSAAMSFWGWSVVIISSIGLVYLYKTTTTDPGYIPTGCDTSSGMSIGGSSLDINLASGSKQELLALSSSNRYKGLDSPALWAGHWHQLCVSCRIVRPLRAKHCSVTDRCIEVFDHYCPWVGNAIGKGNRHYFIVFLWLQLYAMVVSAIVCAIQIRGHMKGESWDPYSLSWMIFFEALDALLGLSVAALAIAQGSQGGRNVTTNELANWHRYKYLHALDGSFHNPFSKGCVANCVEVFKADRAPMAPVYLYRDA
eukprot:gene14669-20703_t